MTDRVYQVNTKQLQEVLLTVRRNGSWDAVSWTRFPTVPGHDPEGRGVIKIKNKTGVGKYIFDEQRSGNTAGCDVHIICEGGFVPCHRAILMYFSPLLNELITENMREVGPPTETSPISIALKDFQLPNMVEALLLLYTGFSTFSIGALVPVLKILEFLKIENTADPELATTVDLQKKKPLKRCEHLDSDDEDMMQPIVRPTAPTSEVLENLPVNLPQKDVPKSTSKEVAENKITQNTHNQCDNVVPGPSTRNDSGELSQPFAKVRPGSLINKIAEPRIQRRVGKPQGKKKKWSVGKQKRRRIFNEPKPSTSKNFEMVDYNRDDDYQPAEEDLISVSESEQSELSSKENDSEIEDEIPPERVLRNRKITSQLSEEESDAGKEKPRNLRKRKENTVQPIDQNVGNSTLAERVKSRSAAKSKRNPHRQKTTSVVTNMEEGPSDEIGESSEAGIQVKQPDEDEDLKCYFCKQMFETDDDLMDHCLKHCGRHLKEKFYYPENVCRICKRHLPTLSHCGLIRHVQDCFMDRGSSVKEDEWLDRSGVENEQPPQSGVNSGGNDSSSPKQKIYHDEKFPVGNPSVVIEKLSDARIAKIISSVCDGNDVVVPRIKGYNYVKATPKVEMPDFFPNETEEQLRERLRVLEQEQMESQLEHEQRRARKKANATATASANEVSAPPPLTVPPLVLNRERLNKSEEMFVKAKELFHKFAVCSCEAVYPRADLTIKCLATHGLSKCWICGELMSLSTPLENHLRNFHSSQSGEVSCFICKASLKFAGVKRHMRVKHLNAVTLQDIGLIEKPGVTNLVIQDDQNRPITSSDNDDERRKEPSVVPQKRKRIGPKSAIEKENKRKKERKDPPTINELPLEPLPPIAGLAAEREPDERCKELAESIDALMHGRQRKDHTAQGQDNHQKPKAMKNIKRKKSGKAVKVTPQQNGCATPGALMNLASVEQGVQSNIIVTEPSMPLVDTLANDTADTESSMPLVEPVVDNEPISKQPLAAVEPGKNNQPAVRSVPTTHRVDYSSVNIEQAVSADDLAETNITGVDPPANVSVVGLTDGLNETESTSEENFEQVYTADSFPEADISSIIITEVTSLAQTSFSQPENDDAMQDSVETGSASQALVPMTSEISGMSNQGLNHSRACTTPGPVLGQFSQIHNPIRPSVDRMTQITQQTTFPVQHSGHQYQSSQMLAVMQSETMGNRIMASSSSTVVSNIPSNMQSPQANPTSPLFRSSNDSPFDPGERRGQSEGMFYRSGSMHDNFYIYRHSQSTSPNPVRINSPQIIGPRGNIPNFVMPRSVPAITGSPARAHASQMFIRPPTINVFQQQQTQIAASGLASRTQPNKTPLRMVPPQSVMPMSQSVAAIPQLLHQNRVRPLTNNSSVVPSRSPSTTVMECPGCTRRFNTRDMLESHIC